MTSAHTRTLRLGAFAGLVALLAGAIGWAQGAEWRWDVPKGFPVPRVPDDNPMSAVKVELGRRLFYDLRLSGNKTYACATCHQQEHAFADTRARGVGSTGEIHPRGPMSLTNVGYSPALTWANPNMKRLEQQALVPMFGEAPVELGLAGKERELLARLAADPRYQRLFPASFPNDTPAISLDHIVKAIAAFERTLISANSPFDREQRGDSTALSASAKRGEDLFYSEDLECIHCHDGFNFTGTVDYAGKGIPEVEYNNTGLYNIGGTGAYPPDNPGLREFTQRPEDEGKFKAPTLRNIAVTAPYMHDGSIPTLEGVLDHYAAGGRTTVDGPNKGVGKANPNKSIFVMGFTLTSEDKADVIAFLNALTDSTFLNDPRFANPWSDTIRPPVRRRR